ncbi:uncharacterized protein LOC132698627 [Cylas formicarius]|uniref:uncharacterized protein LOC132698627 n=1 Tax=Cylas formicarius TaxID=197179 RepID=UPI002958BC23|nr:uncharacterized protein LOC132698627 [Cylas formicarius]
MESRGTQSELRIDGAWDEFLKIFCDVAAIQGRISYCIMSVHAVNPHIFRYLSDYDPYTYLLWNMIYGITIMIATSPALNTIVPFTRFTFGFMGSLAFNYSSLMFYGYLSDIFYDRPLLLTVLGFISGRVMMVHLLAFLYHIDSLVTGTRRHSAFDAMYL